MRMILLDLDGVLNDYKGNYDHNYIPPIRYGAKEFVEKLSSKYELKLFTTRPPELAQNWLIENKLNNYINETSENNSNDVKNKKSNNNSENNNNNQNNSTDNSMNNNPNNDVNTNNNENNDQIEQESENSTDKENTNNTASIDDILYPMYLPTNNYLKNQQKLEKNDGQRLILTFDGDSPFVLIEETVTKSSEHVVIPTFGDLSEISDTIGVVNENSINWFSGNMEYYVVSDKMDKTELLEVARSISVLPVSK